MTTTTQKAEHKANAPLMDLGFDLTITAGPIAHVGTSETKTEHTHKVEKKEYPQIKYTVALWFKGKEVLTTDYFFGVGNVEVKKGKAQLYGDEAILFRTWEEKHNAVFVNKQLWASVAVKLAKAQGVVPQLSDTLYSLLSDAEAFLQAQSFEEWASEFGYDADSRKAEGIYKLCVEIGRKLSRGVSPKAITKAKEILQDY